MKKIENFHDYCKLARETAIYPEKLGSAYAALGLIEELGEILDVWSIPEGHNNRKKEAGDVLWYMSELCHVLMLDIDAVFNYNNTKYFDYSRFFGNIQKEICKFAGVIKKIERDGITLEKKEKVADFLRNCFILIWHRMNSDNIDMLTVAQNNIEKLQSRKERGTLQGDGNDR